MPIPFSERDVQNHVVTRNTWGRFSAAARRVVRETVMVKDVVGHRVSTIRRRFPGVVAAAVSVNVRRILREDYGGGWMDRCVRKVAKKRTRRSAGAVCGALAKRKFGVEKAREMSRAGGRAGARAPRPAAGRSGARAVSDRERRSDMATKRKRRSSGDALDLYAGTIESERARVASVRSVRLLRSGTMHQPDAVGGSRETGFRYDRAGRWQVSILGPDGSERQAREFVRAAGKLVGKRAYAVTIAGGPIGAVRTPLVTYRFHEERRARAAVLKLYRAHMQPSVYVEGQPVHIVVER